MRRYQPKTREGFAAWSLAMMPSLWLRFAIAGLGGGDVITQGMKIDEAVSLAQKRFEGLDTDRLISFLQAIELGRLKSETEMRRSKEGAK